MKNPLSVLVLFILSIIISCTISTAIAIRLDICRSSVNDTFNASPAIPDTFQSAAQAVP